MQTDSQSGADKIVWQLRINPRRDFTTVQAGVCLIPIEFKGWLDGMGKKGIQFPGSHFDSAHTGVGQIAAAKRLKQKPETASCIVQRGCFDSFSNISCLNTHPR